MIELIVVGAICFVVGCVVGVLFAVWGQMQTEREQREDAARLNRILEADKRYRAR